jgi:peptide/nickel transport system permease protein
VASADLAHDATARRVEAPAVVPLGSWRLAWRRLRRNPAAVAAAVVLAAIATACLCAPLYARYVAQTGPNTPHYTDTVRIGGRAVPVLRPETQHLRPGVNLPYYAPLPAQWWHAGGRYVLGADEAGHDVAVQLLYGGRSALEIGFGSSLICLVGALFLGLAAGYRGGLADWTVSRAFDLLWAFPVLLLALALNVVLVREGWHRFGIDIGAGSILVPTLVIAFVRIPYAGRPLRGEALALREAAFVDAARAVGASPLRIVASELLPNVAPLAVTLGALLVGGNIILETSMSFLYVGVQPPGISWGTMIAGGAWLYAGIALTVTVLAVNVLGDALRSALAPR